MPVGTLQSPWLVRRHILMIPLFNSAAMIFAFSFNHWILAIPVLHTFNLSVVDILPGTRR
jgi:hypothetical protein